MFLEISSKWGPRPQGVGQWLMIRPLTLSTPVGEGAGGGYPPSHQKGKKERRAGPSPLSFVTFLK